MLQQLFLFVSWLLSLMNLILLSFKCHNFVNVVTVIIEENYVITVYNFFVVSEFTAVVFILKINYYFFQFSDSQIGQTYCIKYLNQIESWKSIDDVLSSEERVCHQQGLNSQLRAWHSILMFRAECNTTQLSSTLLL